MPQTLSLIHSWFSYQVCQIGADEKFEVNRGWFMSLREKAVSVTKVQGKAASADVESTVSYLF